MTADPSSADFRATMSSFCTGVVAIAAVVDGRPVGMTCQSFISLSLDPPLIAFAPARTSSTYPVLRQARRFAISVLAEDQGDVALALASKGTDKFATVPWHPLASGTPVIDGCLAWIDCTFETEYDAGDHLLVVGRVHELGHLPDGEPLTYYRSSFNSVGGRQSPLSS
ncbi:flavin reductase family protein [Nocardioides endophyticus]|uniref:Flavin reductase family protein n=1 Tax=Nocardioides endophyticus TaxID=1353775 RepID=A0ABP8YVI5_9ACTN